MALKQGCFPRSSQDSGLPHSHSPSSRLLGAGLSLVGGGCLCRISAQAPQAGTVGPHFAWASLAISQSLPSTPAPPILLLSPSSVPLLFSLPPSLSPTPTVSLHVSFSL